MTAYKPTKKRVAKKNAISFDAEKHAFSMWGVNVMEIPGMSLGAPAVLMGEPGSGFTEKFTSARSFCKWCSLVPNNKISGGKLLSSKVPKRKNRGGQVFRLCANSVKSVKTGLGVYFRRQKSKGGHLQAIVATANKMARIFYTMVACKGAFDENKVGLDEKALLQRKIAVAQRNLDKLNLRLSVAEG
jgi:transposase